MKIIAAGLILTLLKNSKSSFAKWETMAQEK